MSTTLSLQERVALVMRHLDRETDPLAQYRFMMTLPHTLLLATAVTHVAIIVPILYTPVVGAACEHFHELLLPPSLGLALRIDCDRGNIAQALAGWDRGRRIQAIVVTDGERILGLGDLGANGLGIPIGKLALYTVLAGVDPEATLPVVLDVGTNNQALLDDPNYTGLKQKRERGLSYYAFVDEFVTAVQARYGKRVLIQWEDFASAQAFTLMTKYRELACSFDDDVEGTASVVLAGLISAAANVPGVPKLADGTYLFYGAGEAGVGTSELLAYAIAVERSAPLPPTEAALVAARRKIWLVDTKGLVTTARLEGLAHHKVPFAHEWTGPALGAESDLEAIIAAVQPNALIGASASPGAFSQSVVAAMCLHSPRPIVFSLSNPTSKAECTAEQALTWSKGAAVFASGSPFAPVTLADGRTMDVSQANNSYIFPAVGLAVIAGRATRVDQHSFYVAAHALVACVQPSEVERTGNLYPDLRTIRHVSAEVATAVAADFIARGHSEFTPATAPLDLAAHVRGCVYDPLRA